MVSIIILFKLMFDLVGIKKKILNSLWMYFLNPYELLVSFLNVENKCTQNEP